VNKNPVAKELRTPKFKSKKVESKKVIGYYMDYDGKERILYDDRD